MKKKSIILIPAILLSLTLSKAQTVTDVVRYGTTNLQGSARFQALSGAFGALGGDVSAININPAGSAVFNHSKTTMSLTNFAFENTTSYFGNEEVVKNSNIDLNQIGGVFVFKNGNRDAKWKKLSLSINYEHDNNFDNEFFAAGQSDNSIDQYFTTFATGVRLTDIQTLTGPTLGQSYLNTGAEFGFRHQQAFLGYWAGIIEPAVENPENVVYTSNGLYNDDGTVDQYYFNQSEGFSSKITVNLATQYTDNFYFGASFNFHNLQYTNYREFTEEGYDVVSPLQTIYFDNLMRTTGNALSFNVGAILRIKKMFRVGLSYQSPTWWYRLTDEVSQRINTNLPDGDLSTINFNLVNVFPDYKIQTPARLTGSFATVFGKHGLLSFDVDYQDFSRALFRPEGDPYFDIQNTIIEARLRPVITYRIGGEYRIARLSLRGGYRLQESPYTNGTTLGELSGYSFGLGYNFGGTQLDLSFNQFNRSQEHQLFDPGFVNLTDLNGRNTNVTLSLSVKL